MAGTVFLFRQNSTNGFASLVNFRVPVFLEFVFDFWSLVDGPHSAVFRTSGCTLRSVLEDHSC